MKTFHFYLLLTPLFSAFLFSSNADAQRSFYYQTDYEESAVSTEIGIATGGSIYFGDLAADKRNYLNESRPHIGLFIRHFIAKHISIRGNLYAGRLEGNDAWYNEPAWRKWRNFSFKTEFYEASAMLEFDLLRNRRIRTGSGFGIYAFAGIGACYTNPQRNFNRVDAAYFGKEDKALSGSDADYERDPRHVALVAPLGFGIRQEIGRISLYTEGSVRQAFDDKLDGFSKSVSSEKYDAYGLLSIGVIFSLGQAR